MHMHMTSLKSFVWRRSLEERPSRRGGGGWAVEATTETKKEKAGENAEESGEVVTVVQPKEWRGAQDPWLAFIDLGSVASRLWTSVSSS